MPSADPAVSDRFQLIEVPRAHAARSFADDVVRGLTSGPKRLSSKYLYDDVGSALFEAITRLPEYYLTAAETEVLRDWGWEMVRVLEEPIDFLEAGSGSAIKTRLLIAEALRVQDKLRYSPIDISTEALYASSMALVEAFPQLTIRAFAGDYFDVLASPALRFERRTLAMFMGSNIGNYEPEDALRLLRLLGAGLRRGDGLLLGADLKKDVEALYRAYDDLAGVTSAFNKNLLSRINRELDADFDLNNFKHIVRYDEARGSVDSFLEAQSAVTVALKKPDVEVHFDAGERVHTESSYKFSDEDIARLARDAGFTVGKTWHDRRKRYSVRLLVKA
jgi:dimethylhistidine N-methyltransferase